MARRLFKSEMPAHLCLAALPLCYLHITSCAGGFVSPRDVRNGNKTRFGAAMSKPSASAYSVNLDRHRTRTSCSTSRRTTPTLSICLRFANQAFGAVYYLLQNSHAIGSLPGVE